MSILNEDAEKAMFSNLAKFHEKHEDVGKEVVDVDPEVEEKAEFIADKMEEVKQVMIRQKRLRLERERRRNDRVAEDINAALRDLKWPRESLRRQPVH